MPYGIQPMMDHQAPGGQSILQWFGTMRKKNSIKEEVKCMRCKNQVCYLLEVTSTFIHPWQESL